MLVGIEVIRAPRMSNKTKKIGLINLCRVIWEAPITLIASDDHKLAQRMSLKSPLRNKVIIKLKILLMQAACWCVHVCWGAKEVRSLEDGQRDTVELWWPREPSCVHEMMTLMLAEVSCTATAGSRVNVLFKVMYPIFIRVVEVC